MSRPVSHNRSVLARPRSRVVIPAVVAVLIGLLSPLAAVPSQAATVGQGFSITPSDLSFILAQIKIAERHAATLTPANPCLTQVGTGPDQIPSPLVSKGLRTVDGSCNNLQPGQGRFGSADQVFPRISTPVFRNAEVGDPDGPGPAAPGPSSYTQKKGIVFDSQPRVISNLIVDQTSTNPAAIAAAGVPVRAQGGDPVTPCTTDPQPLAVPPVEGVPAGCTPSHQTLFIPNVTTDVGLSPPYNSLFTLFGQFFDHGVDQTVKSGGTVFVPLKGDDPLIAGPDHVLGNADDLPPRLQFMVLTRAQNQPGPDGILGDDPATPSVDESADDVQDATNTDSPWVDQSQTYTSHASHQVFLREYAAVDGRPVSTGKLLSGQAAGGDYPTAPDGREGISTWGAVKKQSHDLLGIQLTDLDVLNVPMLATDPYGEFIPGANGLPQFVTKTGLQPARLDDPLTTGVDETATVPTNVLHFDTPFLTDIAHNADPSMIDTNHDGRPDTFPVPDDDSVPSADFAHQPPGTYDDEMLRAHFACGDGRCNENIGLSTIHQIFHSEHDRLIDDITATLNANPTLLAAYSAPHLFGSPGTDISFGFGSRLFQAARFVTEMEYQHLVFEEFARKVQPAINPFEPFAFTQTEINPAVKAEFAHAVYRFGHSMLTDTISRVNADGQHNDISLLHGFLNPPAYYDGGAAGTLSARQAARSVIMGMSDQTGNELDEFVTETLRNNLLGLPLDLASINMARARSEGVPPLNVFRRQVFNKTNDGQMTPYKSWVDFGEHLKHPESLVNFVAAYGQHPTITSATTVVAKREAARLIVNPTAAEIAAGAPPADAAAFMNSTPASPWANVGTASVTGLDTVDLWVGGLAEVTNLFGGLLGSTFNYVFENQLTDLQNGDRLYYLARTPGMNLRTQLEGNSFAELIMRNTDARTLKADAFATADCKFELSNLAGTAAGFTSFGNNVADDPASECDESALLIRMPDGTIQYRARNTVNPSGINGQSVYNGTDGVDRVHGGNDSDTFWGGPSRDWIEGGDGADVALGGEGDDIITDLNGDDVPKGGPGDDAIDAGPGLDIVMGGTGKDFTNGGANANETFGGDGDDFIMLGDSLDAAFGDSGDDYEEGGNQPDLMQGDSGNLFFLDDSQKPGSDILIGQGGDDDYDMEGGDDIGLGGPGIEKVAGASGFDWEIGIGDPQPQDMDLAIPLVPLDILQVGVRDKFNEVEALSGGDLNDVLRGDDLVPSAVGGGGFIGCDVLDQRGLDRISGLDALVPPLTTPLSTVIATAGARDCPFLTDGLTSAQIDAARVWGDGNILLGGGGDDLIEGRLGNDVIDGDKYLEVRLSVRDDAGVEIGSASANRPGQSPMTSQYLRDAAGALTGPTLAEAVFAGTVDPGNIVAVREIKSGAAGVDTAVFSGTLAASTITENVGSITVAGADGVDTLRGIELLRFADQTVDLRPGIPGAPIIAPALAGNTQATVNWDAPASDGNSPITSYQVQVFDGGTLVDTITGIGVTARSRIVTGLTNGHTYTFRVIAVNAFGAGAPSAESNAVTPSTGPTAPGAPTIGTATAGNASATVTWTAPASNGGTAITAYRIEVLSAGVVVDTVTGIPAADRSRVVTGLTNGQTYTFRVIAVNLIGLGSPSAQSNAVTPATVPGAPAIGSAAAGDTTATVTWSAPAATGGSPITSYQVQVLRGGGVVDTVTGIAPGSVSRVVTGLTNGLPYTFRVLAVNAVGSSAPSAQSNAVTPVGAPGAPGIGTATAGTRSATVRWSVPASDGGSALTSYEVLVRTGGAVVRTVPGVSPAATSVVVTGLAEQTTYDFQVRAVNAAGTSAASAVSNAVTIPDTTDPTVTRRFPAAGDTGIRRGVTVSVTFSERVLGVRGTTFVLSRSSNGVVVDAVVTLSADGLTATLNPRARLASGVNYTVALIGGASAIRDTAGNRLASSTWRFTTR